MTDVVFSGAGVFLEERMAAFKDFWNRFRKSKTAVASLLVLTVLLAVAIFAGSLTKHDPLKPGIGLPFQPPSSEFLMGTDDLGRDIFSGVVFGARVSLMVGFTATLTATVIGVIVGSLAGYFGGLVDDLLVKFIELFQCIPRFFLALVIVVLFGNSIWNIVLVIGILSWPRTSRLVRSEYLRVKSEEFVEAARAFGRSSMGIVFKEILPNTFHIVVVNASLEVGAAILIEAGLSFLGAGDPNVISWGRMLFDAQQFLRRAWWMALFPGMAIFTTVLSLNLIGDGLSDALNPKLKNI